MFTFQRRFIINWTCSGVNAVHIIVILDCIAGAIEISLIQVKSSSTMYLFNLYNLFVDSYLFEYKVNKDFVFSSCVCF